MADIPGAISSSANPATVSAVRSGQPSTGVARGTGRTIERPRRSGGHGGLWVLPGEGRPSPPVYAGTDCGAETAAREDVAVVEVASTPPATRGDGEQDFPIVFARALSQGRACRRPRRPRPGDRGTGPARRGENPAVGLRGRPWQPSDRRLEQARDRLARPPTRTMCVLHIYICNTIDGR
jgi:hypothetical protein